MKINKTASQYIIFLTFTIVYQYFFKDAPSLYLSENDSIWYVKASRSMFSGNWLDEYNRLTLIKNSFFPLFLTLIHFFKIKYSTLIITAHHLSILFFIRTFKPKSNLVFTLLLISSFFYPEFFTTYKATIIREDLEVILLFLMMGSIGRLFLNGDQKYLILSSLIAGIGLINRDSGYTWIIPFTIIAIFSTYKEYQKSKNLLKQFSIIALSFLILNIPSFFIKKKNESQYGFYGKSLIYNGEFQNMYAELTSIRHKSDLPTVLGNPLANRTINEIRKTADKDSMLLALMNKLEVKWGEYKNPSTTIDTINGGKQWGVMLLWGLFYSLHDIYDKKYQLHSSPKNFGKACQEIIDEVKSFCSKHPDFDCSIKNKGFIQNPKNWSKNGFFNELIFNLPKFFSKYIYWTLGERKNRTALGPINDDLIWIKNREEEAFDLFKNINYTKKSYEEDRLSSPTLKKLQIFSYLIRYAAILIAIIFIFKNKEEIFKLNFLRQKNTHLLISTTLIFLISNSLYYIYYLMLLKRGYKHLVISGCMFVPLIIIFVNGLVNFKELSIKNNK
tara:strand:- start:482 stop:2155 length:1674 start_codon:yes stop_codon:yes gene_type:complete